MPVGAPHVMRWMAKFVDAWQRKDGHAAAALFTPDAVFHAIPGVAKQMFTGHEEIRRYWERVAQPQSDVEVLLGEPLIQGDTAAVEMWVTLRNTKTNPDDGHWITLIETNILDFAEDGRCRRCVEYFNVRMGRLEPPPGWGHRSAVGAGSG